MTTDQAQRPFGNFPRLARRPLLFLATALLATRRPARAQDQPAATPALAATPVATAATCPADGPCPVGCWEVSDIAAFIESGLMDVTGIRNLSYTSAQGTLAFVFHPDGTIRISAEGYRVTVSAEVRLVGEVDTAVSFDGELAGRYTLTGEVLTLAEITRTDLVITAETPVGAVGIDNDDVFSGGVSRLVCDGDTLRLYPDPAGDVAIVLTRASVSSFE